MQLQNRTPADLPKGTVTQEEDIVGPFTAEKSPLGAKDIGLVTEHMATDFHAEDTLWGKSPRGIRNPILAGEVNG